MKNKYPLLILQPVHFSPPIYLASRYGLNRCANLRIIANVTYKYYCRGFVNESRNCCDPRVKNVATKIATRVLIYFVCEYSNGGTPLPKIFFYHSSGKRENPIELSNEDFYLKKNCYY